MRDFYNCLLFAYQTYLTSSNKGCASAMLMQAWHCSRLALYFTSSKIIPSDYQEVGFLRRKYMRYF